MMSARYRAVLCFGIIAIVLGGARPPDLRAATVEQTGWWWRAQLEGVPVLTAPPDVDDGHLLVQGQPEGATAVAALRFLLDKGESNPVLELVPADGSAVPQGAVIRVCQLVQPWTPVHGGPWDDRPATDCSTSIQARPDTRGVFTLHLAPLVSGDVLDVLITPGPADASPTDPLAATISLKFAAPDSADLQTSLSDAHASGPRQVPQDHGSSRPASFGKTGRPRSTLHPILDESSSVPDAHAEGSARTSESEAPLGRGSDAWQAGPGASVGRARVVALLILLIGAPVVVGAASGVVVASGPGPATSMTSRRNTAAEAPRDGGLGRFRRPRRGLPSPLG